VCELLFKTLFVSLDGMGGEEFGERELGEK
jgi:hypothetical protein